MSVHCGIAVAASPDTRADDYNAASSIAAIHPDIIRSDILSCLDGPSLAAVICSSAQLRALSSDDDLWKHVCASAWPSTREPAIRRVISTLPSGYRSFFSDSYPLLHHPKLSSRKQRRPAYNRPTTELISAVDIFYKDKIVFSKVISTETESGWFRCSPFRIDLIDQKEPSVSTCVTRKSAGADDDEEWLSHLEENLTLSWIVIDPAMKRAANISSREPISVQRHWLTGEVHVHYGTVVAGEPQRGSAAETVQFVASVTFGAGKSKGQSGEEWQEVTEVSLQVEDMEDRNLNGRDALVILGAAMDGGRRRKRGPAKEQFEEFEKMKKERRRRQLKAERTLDIAGIAIGLAIFVTFWSYIFFR